MSNHLVTPGFLFRWSFPVPQIANLPGPPDSTWNLPDSCKLPEIMELDGRSPFANVRVAWNPAGLCFSLDVSGRKPSTASNHTPGAFTVWIDTRNTQGVHRATRFCHQFSISLPDSNRKPRLTAIPISRSRDTMVMPDLSAARLTMVHRRDGYWLAVWLPSEVFTGFDPATSPKLGFHYKIVDPILGEQLLVPINDFPYSEDPSLWQTLELVS